MGVQDGGQQVFYTTATGTDSFHVTAPSPYTPQQGGGAVPPGGPALRSIHHPHAGQQPPPQQQTQGPAGPAPTSTPPGTEMNKQGIVHMQGQQQITQGDAWQLPLNYGVSSNSRPASTQAYFGGVRGPAPARLQTHRGQIVNVPTNNVSQPMYSPHVSMQQMPPTMYAPTVSAQMPSQQVVYPGSIAPMFPSQPRHQNHTGSAFYPQPGPQQLMVPGLFTGFASANTPPGQFYSFTTPVNMRTGTVGAPGVGGPGLVAAAAQPVGPGGGPPSGMPQPGQISLSMVSSGGMSIPPIPGDPAASVGLVAGAPTHQHKMRRKHAIDIVDPKTNKAIPLFDENNGNTPPRSGDSSARVTPQLNIGPGSLDVVADFAARVAKAASEETSSPPQPIIHSQIQADSEPHIVSINGPDVNSLPEQTISKQKILPIEETSHWKQNQTTSIGSIASVVEKSDANLVKTDIKIVSHISLKPASYSVSEPPQHIPVIINMEPQVETQRVPVIINKDPLVESQHIPLMINKEPRVEVLTLQPPTPVVSALTNSPDVDLPHRPSPSKESFPALSKPSIQPGAPLPSSSPRRKRADAVDKMGGPNSAEFFPSMSVHATQVIPSLPPSSDSKSQKKSSSPTSEETTPLTTPQPPAQQPKEKREEKRDRERSSQGKEMEKGTPRGRDRAHGRETSRGLDKAMQNTEKKSVQPHGRDREKSSQGREKSSSQHSRRETTPAPVVVDEAHDVPPTVTPALQTVETKQPNGDAVIVDASEGKAIQRSKQKRVAKMKDFNRKGSEKEGSDMDAFVEPSSDLPAPPPAPPSPVTASVPPVAAKSPSPTPESQQTPPATIVPEEVAKPEPNEVERQLIKVELDLTKEEELESETDKLVAARNEENTKVSAAVLKEDAPPIIEYTQPKAVTVQKVSYKEDQWSPNNPDGKKKYDRDFLMQFQSHPQSQKKPDNLPDLEVVKDGQSNRGSRQGESRSLPNRSQQDSFTPTFMRGSSLRGPPVTKRNSQQGSKQKGGGKQNMIHVSLPLNQDIKLRETENAWKPGRMKPLQLTEEEAKSEELYKKVRSVLNKLTPQKFQTLVSQVQALPINNAERLQGVINIVFEKAVDEPNFSEAYAQMCKVLSDMQVKAERHDKDDPEFVNFRKLLVTRCQKEFEKNSEQELDRGRRLKEILECQDAEKKKEFQINYEEEERKIRMKSVGNIRFIGELFKLKMLTQNIMQRCIKHLLDEGDEESLECLCKLLTTVGKDLEQKQSLASYFEEMKRRSQMKGQISSRVRFMLQDVIDLRASKWVSRRDDLIPKTIDQIQKEAEKETLEMHINLNSGPQTPRRQEDRNMYSGDRKKRGGTVTNDEGWTNVTKPARYAVDTKKFLAAAGKDIELNMSLGSRYQFSSWMGGAGTNKAPGTEKKNYAPVHANMYSALDVEEKKAPPTMASSRLPPGKAVPPGERERPAPFIKSVPDDTRQSSRSSSRDSSARHSEESFRPSPAPSGGAVDDIDQRDGKLPKVTLAPIIPDPSLSHEQIVKKTQFLIDEFLQNINNHPFQEARQTVIETFVENNIHVFVEESLNYLMEKSSQARQFLGKLMADLIKNGVLKKDHYIKGLLQFLELADDVAIDIPKIWLYVAETIVPLFSGSEFSLHDFLLVGSKTNPTKLIPEVFNILIKEQGHNWVKERWESEGLKWTTYLPPSSVDSFLKEHKLTFLNGSGSTASICGTPVSLSIEDVHKKLLQFLSNESGPAAPFDQIFAWISVNVNEKVKEPQFARVLSSAVFRSAIYKHGNSWKLQDDGLTRNQLLLTKYIDNKEQLELQCLYALQALVHELEHPQGLLCQIFQSLWDENIISSESFIAWEKSNDPQEMNGKAVALKSLTTFFTALKEAFEESSCEES